MTTTLDLSQPAAAGNACCNNIKLLDDVIHLGLVDGGDDVDGYSYLHPMGSLPGGMRPASITRWRRGWPTWPPGRCSEAASEPRRPSALDTGDDVLFSLAPGFPTLAAIGGTAREVLRSTITAGANPNPSVVYTTGVFLGIPAGGDLDALDDTDSNAIRVILVGEATMPGLAGGGSLYTWYLRHVDPGPDGLYGTPDDIVAPLPGESVDFQSLDPSVATLSPPSGVTGGAGEVSTVVYFVDAGATHVEAAVPARGIQHYSHVIVALGVPTLGIWGATALVLGLCAAAA